MRAGRQQLAVSKAKNCWGAPIILASIGVHIAQMIVQPKDGAKIDVQLKAGFLSLFSNGYLGVVTSGGLDFANFLASKGLSGMGAIKDVIKKLKG